MNTAAVRATTIKIDPSIKERVKRLADARHQPVSGLMMEALEEYVEREEKREAFRQDGLNAWKEYQETGLHATGDEVIAWLETWGEENEKPAPVCHK